MEHTVIKQLSHAMRKWVLKHVGNVQTRISLQYSYMQSDQSVHIELIQSTELNSVRQQVL